LLRPSRLLVCPLESGPPGHLKAMDIDRSGSKLISSKPSSNASRTPSAIFDFLWPSQLYELRGHIHIVRRRFAPQGN
jgi:hypothetical protein